jgi:predicted component of viral defense system (DUF524 family)
MNLIKTFKDWIIVFSFAFFGFGVILYEINDFSSKLIKHQDETAKLIVKNIKMNKKDSVEIIKETVHDTIREYIQSITYSSMFTSKVDTFEIFRGSLRKINIDFGDNSYMEFSSNEYKILCNGKLYNKINNENITECSGEWVLTLKGDRN